MNPPPFNLPTVLYLTSSTTLLPEGIPLTWDGHAWVGSAIRVPLGCYGEEG